MVKCNGQSKVATGAQIQTLLCGLFFKDQLPTL